MRQKLKTDFQVRMVERAWHGFHWHKRGPKSKSIPETRDHMLEIQCSNAIKEKMRFISFKINTIKRGLESDIESGSISMREHTDKK